MQPTTAQHPIRRVVKKQGRSLTWLSQQLGITYDYLYRILLPEGHPESRPAPEWFYAKASDVLGTEEDWLRPETIPAAVAA